jgi:protocatechuate 3,4-dioxygenase beta subunit
VTANSGRVLALTAATLLVAALGDPVPAQPRCAPTRPDMLGPFYTPNAPERTQTGRGLAVTGRVISAADCAPLAGARLEWWSANTRGEYDDAHRATQAADPEGRYRYETDVPGRYPPRPVHLHVRVTAPGHRPLVTQLYPKPGEAALHSDFVLVRE